MHHEIMFDQENHYTRIDLRQFPPYIFKDKTRRNDVSIFVDGVGRLTVEINGKIVVDIPDWNREPTQGAEPSPILPSTAA